MTSLCATAPLDSPKAPEDAAPRAKQRTRKNATSVSKEEKTKMWSLLESERAAEKIRCADESVELDTDLCGLCNTVLMFVESGLPTCANPACGVIYKNALDYSPEWRYYGADDRNANDPTRCGNPINPLLVESSFGCKILCDSRSSYEMRKIRKWTEWMSIPHREKCLYEEFQFISVMARNAGIPKIFVDYAMVVHKEISEQKMFRGLNRDGIKAASIYISCRANGAPRAAFEIAEIFKLDKSSATTGCSNAMSILHNIERGGAESDRRAPLPVTAPSQLVERFCSKLEISGELTKLAFFIAGKVELNNAVNDNTPQAVAAGVIYLISVYCGLGVSKAAIKTVCGVSEVTITKCFRKMEAIRHDLIPACVLEKYAPV